MIKIASNLAKIAAAPEQGEGPLYAHFLHMYGLTPREQSALRREAVLQLLARKEWAKNEVKDLGPDDRLEVGSSTGARDDAVREFLAKYPSVPADDIGMGGSWAMTPRDGERINSQSTVLSDHTQATKWLQKQLEAAKKERSQKMFLSRLFSLPPTEDRLLRKPGVGEAYGQKVKHTALINAAPGASKKEIRNIMGAMVDGDERSDLQFI